jgi:hemerythrin
MARPLSDALGELNHDHASMSDALEALHRARRAGADAESLVEHAERLRDEFLDHFGDEEEHLFPALAELVPKASAELDELRQSHDALCGLAVRIAGSATAHGSGAQLDALLERLDVAYREHARREVEVLRATLEALTPAQREALLARVTSHRS